MKSRPEWGAAAGGEARRGTPRPPIRRGGRGPERRGGEGCEHEGAFSNWEICIVGPLAALSTALLRPSSAALPSLFHRSASVAFCSSLAPSSALVPFPSPLRNHNTLSGSQAPRPAARTAAPLPQASTPTADPQRPPTVCCPLLQSAQLPSTSVLHPAGPASQLPRRPTNAPVGKPACIPLPAARS